MEAISTASLAPERLLELPGRLESHDGFVAVLAALQDGGRATLDGVWGGSRALVAATLARRCRGSLVVVSPKADAMDRFAEDLALFTRTALERFPAWESGPNQRIIFDEIYGDRLRTLKLLARGERPDVLITSVQALLQTSAVELPGEFSQRGGILDIFAPDWYQPVRIELFDDEVESIRRFDVAHAAQPGVAARDRDHRGQAGSGDRGHFSRLSAGDGWFC
jgi:transcription-repair coupling factor (superfamily II helicase)